MADSFQSASRTRLILALRNTQKEQLEKIPMGFKNETADIRKKCQRWANDHKHQLKFKQSAITIPGNDRAEDNWKPLATIAGVIGKNWFVRLQKISKDMMDFAEESDEISILLLEDVKETFEDMDMDKIFTNSLLRSLNDMEDRPWGDFRNGKGITAHKIAQYLSEYNIRPKTIRIAEIVKKGYDLESFVDAFQRYLPS